MMETILDFLFRDGHVADAILAVIALEAALVPAVCRARGRSPPPGFLASLAAGALLALGLRFALDGGRWAPCALSLAGALVAHLVDMRARFAGSGGTTAPDRVAGADGSGPAVTRRQSPAGPMV